MPVMPSRRRTCACLILALSLLVVFLFLAISAYMTLRGLFGLVRINLIETTNIDLARRGFATQIGRAHV